MNLYAESSAVLSWLLREPGGKKVERCLNRAQLRATSELTRLEVLRSLVRARTSGTISHEQGADLGLLLEEQTADWTWIQLDRPILKRAEELFPIEPIRTLDALHLASALELSPSPQQLAVLSLDRRVRENASALGFVVLPATT